MTAPRLLRHYRSCANCDHRVKGICTCLSAPLAGTTVPLWRRCDRQVPKIVPWIKKEEAAIA